MHPLPEWTRSCPTRYQSSYLIFLCGTDPIRSDTGACTSSTGMNPILSGPVQELVHYLPVWNRSYPLRYRSLYTLFRNGPDPIRPDTGAYTLSSGVEPILSDPIPEFVPYLPEGTRSVPIRYRSLYTLSRNGSDPSSPREIGYGPISLSQEGPAGDAWGILRRRTSRW
jgi:hypothetical protein